FAAGAHTAARAQGTFGLVRGTNGTLKFDVAVDSLGAFNRWIPRQPGATTAIAPRPGRVAQAIAKAKADSARVARATEMQRIITGRPGPQLVVNAPKPVPADTV